MKKLLASSFCLATALCLISCQKEQPETSTSLQNDALKSSFLKQDNKMNALAKGLAASVDQKDFVALVHQSVSKALSYGLDENFYLKELAVDNNKVAGDLDLSTLKSALNRNFPNPSKAIHLSAKSNASSVGSDVQQVSDIIANDDIQIYWPYSENWDGMETPAIVILDETNQHMETLPALLPLKDAVGKIIGYDTIIVNEEYAVKHPVWVLDSQPELAYSELPSLSSGERTNNGVYFMEPDHLNAANTVNSVVNNVTDTKVYKIDLGRVMVSQHFDPWTKGGSEMYFLFTETTVNSTVVGGPIGASTQINSIFVDRPRKTINKKQWVDVNKIAVSNWRPEVHKMAMVVFEKDWEGWAGDSDNQKHEFDIPVTYTDASGSLKTHNVKGSISVHKRDEHITTKVFDRSYIFSNFNFSNNNWTIYTERGVNWTLPYYIGTVNPI